MSTAEEAPGKAEKGGENDISGGPVKERGIPCIGRDPLWCALFLVHIGVFVYLGVDASANGDYKRMVNQPDFMGNVCGAKGTTRDPLVDGVDMRDYPYTYYTLNVTSVMKEMADGMGLGPVSTSFGTGFSEDTFTDPSAMIMQMMGGNEPGFPANLIQKASTYFHKVCVKSCDPAPEAGEAEGDYPFRYTYWKGYPSWSDATRMLWEGVGTGGAALKSFSRSDCPYPAALCVPLNSMIDGMVMTSITTSEGSGICMPTVASAQALANSVASASQAAADVIPSDFTEKTEDFVGSMVADLVTAWWTFAVMAFVGLVIGVLYLVLMRYIVGPLVWFSLIGVAVLLFSGAGLLYVQSITCATVPEDEGRMLTDVLLDPGRRLMDEFPRRMSEESSFGSCPESCGDIGCKVGSQTARQGCVIGAAIIAGLGLFYLLCLCCNYNRINLAIALNKVAARFVAQQPYSLLIPPIQIVIVFLYLILWMYLTVNIVSYVPDYFQVVGGTYSYREAYGIEATGWFTSGTAGRCWENGQYQVILEDDPPDCALGVGTNCYGGAAEFNTTSNQENYRCTLLAYVGGQDYRFWYAFFSLLWINAFMIAFGQTSIAGAVASWYFSPNDNKLSPIYVPWGIKTTLTYHMGSIALGSMIIALIQLLKYYLAYLSKQAEKQHNKLLSIIFGILSYCVWCFEKCAKFLSKNAYIQIALLGKKFCYAAKDAFWLIFRNALRIAAAAMISPVINLLGFLIITLMTVFIGFCLLEVSGVSAKMSSPYGACFIYLVEGYVCGKLVMNVFGLAVDTVLQCFVADEEINGTVGEHTPHELGAFLSENVEALNAVKGDSGGGGGGTGAQA